jgi:molybdate transport system regulatory protein
MNCLKGVISAIDSTDAMSIVDVQVGGDTFSSLMLETPRTSHFMVVGKKVTLAFKESEVSISKDLECSISLRNRIKGSVKEVEKGKLLSRIEIDYMGNNVVSIITTRSVTRLGIKTGDLVLGLVKANEMTLMEDNDGSV